MKFNRFISGVLVLVMLLTAGIACVPAGAEQYVESFKNLLYMDGNGEVFLWNAGYDSDEDTFDLRNVWLDSGWNTMTCETDLMVKKLKSSNPKVVSVKKLRDGGFSMRVRKTGKADISYVYGDTKRIESYIVKKYTNPCRSLKIGNTEYAKLFDKTPSVHLDSKKLSGKIVVKPAKGWKLVEIRQGGARVVKNKKKVSLRQNGTYHLRITFQKKGSNEGCTIEFLLL